MIYFTHATEAAYRTEGLIIVGVENVGTYSNEARFFRYTSWHKHIFDL